MTGVFCIDLGYSLKARCREWEADVTAYPGQALYGINHFKEFDVCPVFEWCEHKDFFGKWYAVLDELIKLISMVRYRKEYQLIYIPHAHYSRWLLLLKKLKLIKKPIVVCMHNKNNLWGLIRVCDYVITINPNLEKKLLGQYEGLKIKYIPLLAERKSGRSFEGKIRYDIISIGNTYRDYQVLLEAMEGLTYNCLIVTSQGCKGVPPNVTVINDKLSYERCLELYMQAKVIALPVAPEAEQGVFGLTSLVDALYVEKPVIVTRTTGIGIPIDQNHLGIEVEAGSPVSMRQAICRLLGDDVQRDMISHNIKEFNRINNMKKSAGEICEIFNEILKK